MLPFRDLLINIYNQTIACIGHVSISRKDQHTLIEYSFMEHFNRDVSNMLTAWV